jgi:hypothetical protein
VYQKNNF